MSDVWRGQANVKEAAFTGQANGDNLSATSSTSEEWSSAVGQELECGTSSSIGYQNGSGDPYKTLPSNREQKVLLIETNEETVRDAYLQQVERTKQSVADIVFQRPRSFRKDYSLHPHQERGVQWLQTCLATPDRQGVLLADDMGVGKTIQLLTFLASCIESDRFPDLSRQGPPFRPILIVVPLILLETQNWEREMERFFVNQGSIFWPVLALHGSNLYQFRRDDAEGPELEVYKPILDLDRIQKTA